MATEIKLLKNKLVLVRNFGQIRRITMLLLPDTSAGHFRISVRKLRNQGFGLQICGKKKEIYCKINKCPFSTLCKGTKL